MGKDYYGILGVEHDASPEDIRNAYLRLARKWHPDQQVNDRDKEVAKPRFQHIAEAYEILSHPTRRQVFDKYGEEGLTAGGKRTATGAIMPHPNKGIPPNSGNRLAGQFFGYGIHGLHPTTGEPLGGNENLPTKNGIPGFNLQGFNSGKTVTSANGMRTTTYTRPQKGKSANAESEKSGVKEPSNASSGPGSARSKRSAKKPKKRSVMTGLECTLEELFYGCEKDAEWKAYEDGETFTKAYTVDVKPGWMIGNRVDIEDEHDEVMIIITEAEHEIFTRKKEDLFCTIDITLQQAMCGGQIVIPTIVKDKRLKLHFNGTIKSGFVHEIPGHGMPIVDSKRRGKLIVTFNVVLPEKLTNSQRKQISEILMENGGQVLPPRPPKVKKDDEKKDDDDDKDDDDKDESE